MCLIGHCKSLAFCQADVVWMLPQHMFVQLYCVVGQRLRDWCRTLVCQTSQKHLLLYMQSSLVAVQIEHLSSQLNKILLAMAVSLGSCSCASGHLAAISVSGCDLLAKLYIQA